MPTKEDVFRFAMYIGLALMLCMKMAGCSDNPVQAENNSMAYDLSQDILGTWEFTTSNRGLPVYTEYKFTETGYNSTTMDHDGRLIWGEVGDWQVLPSSDNHIGTLVLHVHSSSDEHWNGFVNRFRVEIQGNFIWIDANGGVRNGN